MTGAYPLGFEGLPGNTGSMNGSDETNPDDEPMLRDDGDLDMLEQEGRDTLAGEMLRERAVDDLFGRAGTGDDEG